VILLTCISIIAVHGLNPRSKPNDQHAWNTWRKPDGDEGRLWLRDDLPKDTSLARIFLYEYNSKLIYWGNKGQFSDQANDLLEEIFIERVEVTSNCLRPRNPCLTSFLGLRYELTLDIHSP
jgi:hypothetical protein